MAHPIHIHGHKFWVLGSGEGYFKDSPLNLIDPIYRDTVDVPKNGWLVVRFKSDNPGVWLLHCHVEWHAVTGMAIVFNEAFERIVVPDIYKVSPSPPLMPTPAMSHDHPNAGVKVGGSVFFLLMVFVLCLIT
jgi:hypothetical protein